MKLDRVGVEYMINLAKDIGFDLLACDTREATTDAPVITLRFRQTRTLIEEPPTLTTPLPTAEDIEHVPTSPSKLDKLQERLTTLDE